MCCRPNLCWTTTNWREKLLKKKEKKGQSTGNRSNVADTVTTAYSASLSTSTSHDFSQSTNLMETQTQLNSPAAYSEVQTTDTNLNTNIHQLVDMTTISHQLHIHQVDPYLIYQKVSLRGHTWDIENRKTFGLMIWLIWKLYSLGMCPVDLWVIKLTPNSFTVQHIQTDVDSLTKEQVRSLFSLQEWT